MTYIVTKRIFFEKRNSFLFYIWMIIFLRRTNQKHFFCLDQILITDNKKFCKTVKPLFPIKMLNKEMKCVTVNLKVLTKIE